MSDENLSLKEIDCAAVRERLTAYADGELSAEEEQTVRRHCTGCVDCAEALSGIEKLRTALPSWSVEERYVWERVEARLSSASATTRTHSLGRVLLERRAITSEQWETACTIQSATPDGDIGRILMDLGFATERDVVEARAVSEGVPFLDLMKHKPEPSAINVVPAHVAKKCNALPVKKDGQRLWVAMKNPKDVVAVDDLRMVSRCMIQPMAAVPSDLERALEEAYRPAESGSDAILQRLLVEMRSLTTEVHALRGEVRTLREELAENRRQSVTRGSVLRVASGRGLVTPDPLPYAPPNDAPIPLS